MTAIDPRAIELIKNFEGYLKPVGGGMVKAYLCPAGVPTIGWGSTFYEDRRPVRLGDAPIDRDRATQLLDFELVRVCAPALAKGVKVPLHPLMHGALISFTINCGTGALLSSTLLKRVNARRWADVPKEFRKWTRGGGRVLNGLVRRREAEAALFMLGVKALGNGGPVTDPVAANVPVANSDTSVIQPDVKSQQSVAPWRDALIAWFRWAWGK